MYMKQLKEFECTATTQPQKNMMRMGKVDTFYNWSLRHVRKTDTASACYLYLYIDCKG